MTRAAEAATPKLLAHHRHRQLPAAGGSRTPSWRRWPRGRHRDVRRMDRRAHRHPARHFAEADVTCSDLAVEAARRALEAAGCDAEDDRPDHRRHLDARHGVSLGGLHPAAQARHRTAAPRSTCRPVLLGFVYALTVADAMIRTGARRGARDRRGSVLAHPRLSRTAPPACCSATAPAPWCWKASDTRASSRASCTPTASYVDILCVPGTCLGGKVLGDPLLKMDGPAVFKLAVKRAREGRALGAGKAGRTEADIDWLIPHQANIRIMQSTAKKLKLPLERWSSPSTSTATPRRPRFRWRSTKRCARARSSAGDTLMLEGVGGGFTWGAVLLDY
jgi:3-oxoacyl-[acyl-carrier-protein] synthase-3